MKEFIAKFGKMLTGVLSGWDRLVIRGELRVLYAENGGMQQYLKTNQVLLKNFRDHVHAISKRLKEASLAAALASHRPVIYVRSPKSSKEEIARSVAEQDNIRDGLICVLTCVEPCMSFSVVPNGKTKQLDLKLEQRQCLHLYHYWMHPVLGFMHGRIQTWFPFRIQMCMNGREWLSRQMDQAGIRYRKQDNCFPWIEDFGRAQELMDQQLSVDWPATLEPIASALNPIHDDIFARFRVKYYWTIPSSEYATDVVFRRAEDLRRIYPRMVRHGILNLSSPDVLRFLGRKIAEGSPVPDQYAEELFSDLKRRQEGVRLKHFAATNSIKAYDKAYTPVGSVLRAETTINDEEQFWVFRPKEGGPEDDLAWRRMRRGVADTFRRAEVSRAANERYLEALAGVDDSTRLADLVQGLEQPVRWKKARIRGLRLFEESDAQLLAAIGRGEFALNGFRNRDLQAVLFEKPAEDRQAARRRSAAVGRQLRMLRAHGLIHKLAHTHRYQLMDRGRQLINGLQAAQAASVSQLIQIAA
jgi:hypothetical protein